MSLVQGLAGAGLKVSKATAVEELSKEQLVVLGPSVKAPARVARAVRKALPGAQVAAAMARGFKAAWADHVLPLPLSRNDLRVRLVEWQNRGSAEAGPARLGDGIFDGFTSFYTFAHFKEVLFVEVKRARRYGLPLALAIVSLDDLPDAREVGLFEQLMSGVALAIRRSLRDTDFPVQYAPSQVLLLMPHTDLAGALIVGRRVSERVARASLSHGDSVYQPSVSIGIAALAPGQEGGFGELVRHALAGVEQARQRGSNRVEFVDASAQDSGAPPAEG